MLQYDPVEAIQHLSSKDDILADAISRLGGFTLELLEMHSPFETLLRSIVFQQLSGKAAATIHRRVMALFPNTDAVHPEDLLETPDDSLRGAGMSRAKVAAVKDLASKTLDGTVPSLDELHRLENEAIIERLTAVRGIGPWTVEMLLIFRLGRADVLPITDLGIRRGFKIIYHLDDLPKPKELLAYGSRGQPYRSVASWYLWRATDTTDLW